MFNSLCGKITAKLPQKLFIETHGIEWDVNVPDSTLNKLPVVGEQGKVYVWLQHTDALMVLFGFATENERSLFFDLLKVDGIGPKGALKIMSNISSENLIEILNNGDLALLQKVPGVGKKTAAKMLLQLKGKLSLENNATPSKKESEPYEDVVIALVDMGYERKKAEETVSRIASELEKDSAFVSSNATEKEDTMFRKAIVELSQ